MAVVVVVAGGMTGAEITGFSIATFDVFTVLGATVIFVPTPIGVVAIGVGLTGVKAGTPIADLVLRALHIVAIVGFGSVWRRFCVGIRCLSGVGGRRCVDVFADVDARICVVGKLRWIGVVGAAGEDSK